MTQLSWRHDHSPLTSGAISETLDISQSIVQRLTGGVVGSLIIVLVIKNALLILTVKFFLSENWLIFDEVKAYEIVPFLTHFILYRQHSTTGLD